MVSIKTPPGIMAKCVLLLFLPVAQVLCDYDCVCNYAVETSVYSTPNTNGQPIGYLYEFDCKPQAGNNQSPAEFYSMQFEKELGYVKKNAQMQIQSCPGSVPDTDLIPTTVTTGAHTSTTSTISTITSSAITKATVSASTLTPTTTVSPTTTASPTTTVSPTSTVSVTPATTVSDTPTPTSTIATRTTVLATAATTSSAVSSPTTIPLLLTTAPFFHSANVTGTPYEYIGVGYNALTGNPESRPDSGLNIGQKIFQLTGNASSVREATYEKHQTCIPSDRRYALHGSKQYQDELKLFVETSSTHITQVKEAAFTFSPEFQTMRPSLDNASVIYFDFISSCEVGTAKYLTENAAKNGFHVTREFAKDVCALPTDSNSSMEYMQFLDKWGTSIVTKVVMGTRQIDRYQTTASALFQHVQQTEPQLLEYTASHQGYPASITINTIDYINSPAGSTKIGSHVSLGNRAEVVPIMVKVVPIYNALNWSYWQTIMDELTAEGICSDSLYGTGMKHYAANLKLFLSQYSEYKAPGLIHTGLTDYNIKVPIAWPTGTYGLMQTTQGCPGANTHWSTGWRLHDTEDLGAHNTYTSGINHYMKGDFGKNDIKTYFCIKTTERTDSYDQIWPNGTYCLLKYHSCPIGFASGYIHWDDEDLNNGNKRGGILPDGTYDRNTRIYYCCRNDASPQKSLLLPTDRPFILIRYGTTCQTVQGMQVHDLHVKWDDEDLGNKDKTGGMHPMDDGGSKNHQLHFCYYSSSSNSPSLIG